MLLMVAPKPPRTKKSSKSSNTDEFEEKDDSTTTAKEEENDDEVIALFRSEQDRELWENIPFRPILSTQSFAEIYRRIDILEELKQTQSALFMAPYTAQSWQQMEQVRLQKRDKGCLYGSMHPQLPVSKNTVSVFTVDWNMDTGRIMAVGMIFDPHNKVNPSNCNRSSVRLFENPYNFLNAYVYGGPRWRLRNTFKPHLKPYIHILEQLVHEQSWLPAGRHDDPNSIHSKCERMVKCCGLKKIHVKYAYLFEERSVRSGLPRISLRTLFYQMLD